MEVREFKVKLKKRAQKILAIFGLPEALRVQNLEFRVKGFGDLGFSGVGLGLQA